MNLTLEEFYKIVHDRKEDYYRMTFKKYHQNYANISLTADDKAEHYIKLIVDTVKKIEKGTAVFTCENDIKSYFIKCLTRSIKNAYKKQRTFNNHYNRDKYIIEYYDTADETTIEEPSTNTEHIYHQLFSYVFSRFSYRDASLYKLRVLNKLNYNQLAEQTGFKRNMLWKALNRIEKDVKQNRYKILNSKYPSISNIYNITDSTTTVADAINKEYREFKTTSVSDYVFEIAQDDSDRLRLLELTLSEFLELYY